MKNREESMLDIESKINVRGYNKRSIMNEKRKTENCGCGL